MKRAGRRPPQPLIAAFLIICLAAGCSRPVEVEPGKVEYVPNEDYHLVMAEIAIQRGQYPTAAQEYLAAAQQSRDSATARRATEFAYDYGYDRYALSSATRWLELEPDSTLANEYLGRLQLRRHRLDRAVRHYAAAMGPREQRSGDDYLALDAELSTERNVDGVLRLLLRLHGGAERTDGFRMAVARAAFRAGRYPLALEYARQASEGPHAFEAELLGNRVLFASGSPDEALARVEALALRQPVLALELEHVRLLAASRREPLALQQLSRLLAHYGRQPALLQMRAMIYIGLGEFDSAERDLDEVASAGRNVYESFYYLGDIEFARGNHEQAIRHYERIGAGDYLLPAQSRIAEVEAARGQPDAGLAHLDEFAEDYPAYAYEIMERRARLLRSLGRIEEALAAYDQLLRVKPPTPGLLVTRGILLDQLGRRADAIDSMRDAVAIDPYDAEALNSLGYTLALTGRRLDEAHALVTRAVDLDPDSPPILDSVGWIAFLNGDYANARSWLQLAYDRLPDPEVAAHLGEVLYAMGEKGSARMIWQEALIQNPDSRPLLETIARYPR